MAVLNEIFARGDIIDGMKIDYLIPPMKSDSKPEAKAVAFATFDQLKNIAKPHKYSTTQIVLPDNQATIVQSIGKMIDPADLAEDGLETEPHITVLYGLETDDAAEVQDKIRWFRQFQIMFGNLSTFEPDFAKNQEVLKIDVISDELRALHELIKAELPNVQTHPEYTPHVTIAYLKPGTAAKYLDDNLLAGQHLNVQDVEFSNRDRKKTSLMLLECPPCPMCGSEKTCHARTTGNGNAICTACGTTFSDKDYGKTPAAPGSVETDAKSEGLSEASMADGGATVRKKSRGRRKK